MSSKPTPCISIGTHGNTKQYNAKTVLRLIMVLRALRVPNHNFLLLFYSVIGRISGSLNQD